MDDFVMVGIGLANGEELLKSLRSKNIVKIVSYIFRNNGGDDVTPLQPYPSWR